MIFSHRRQRRRVSLLAAGALEGREREETRAHLTGCPRCRLEHDALREVVRELESDPLRGSEPELALGVLVDRVEHELQRTLATPRSRPRWWLVALPVAAATLASTVVVPTLVDHLRPAAGPVRAAIPTLEPAPPAVPEDALARIERNLAREHAARYLSEASELLVSVSATGLDCDRHDGRLDVGEAPERSRELLERRRLMLSGGEAVASARGVLDDVELALREVADLPSCVRPRDVERVREQVERRQLLMRIRLMTRELEG